MSDTTTTSPPRTAVGRLRPRRRLAAATLALICATGALAACGDDDDEGSGGATTTEAAAAGSETESETEGGGEPADGAAACDAYTEVTMALNGEPDPATVEPLLDTLDQEAPEEIAEPLGVMVSAARTVLESGGEDFAPFEAPEFAEAQGEVDPYMFENCEFDNRFEVSAVDYAFEGIPAEVPAGSGAFLMTNDGEEAHELALMRKKEGVTESWDEILEMGEEEGQAMVEPVGGAFAPTPGSKGLAITDLTPGDYVAICFVPTGTVMGEGGEEGGDGPPHFTAGMKHEFTVTAG